VPNTNTDSFTTLVKRVMTTDPAAVRIISCSGSGTDHLLFHGLSGAPQIQQKVCTVHLDEGVRDCLAEECR